jgi:class 3 adenylate cyclase
VRLRAALMLARLRGSKPFRPGEHLDVSELEEALASEPDVDLASRVEARAGLAEALIVAGDAETALAIVASARRDAASAGRDGDDDALPLTGALSRLDFAEGIHRQAILDLTGADHCFVSGCERARRAGNVHTEDLALSRRALGGLLRGDIAWSRRELAAVRRQTTAHGTWGEWGFAAAQLAFADTLAGRPEAAERIDEAHRQWRRTRAQWIAVLLSGVMACHGARTRGLADTGAQLLPGAELPSPSSVTAALAAVEAFDVGAARDAVRTAGWRQGLRGQVTVQTSAIPVALVEVGALLRDGAMVGLAADALGRLYDAGVLVTIAWPATVPRLLAVVSRHAGDLGGAQRHLDHALGLAQREALEPERAKVMLESARLAAARGDADAAAELLASAVRSFDALSMHGWIARCHEEGRELGLPATAGPEGVGQERTIFTDDVVSSTASNARLGDALYLEQLRVHDRLVRARLREFGGLEVKHTGDGLNAAFDRPAAAVDCARSLAADFAAWNAAEPDLALRIRCGIARGPVIPSGGDFFGLVQSEAARLCALASPGEILVSAGVLEGCDPGAAVESLGRQDLRGLPSAVEVFRIVA